MNDSTKLGKLLDGKQSALGIIASIPSTAATQALASAGFDWQMIDMEHAPIDSARQMLSAIRHSSYAGRMILREQ